MKFYDSGGVDRYTPADALLDKWEPEPEAGERDFAIAATVFKLLCRHWFALGPNPEAVLMRVFAAAADRRPDLLAGMSAKEITLARSASQKGIKWRVERLLGCTGNEWAARYRSMQARLAAAFVAAGRPELCKLSLGEALEAGYGEETPDATETLSRVLERIFCRGNHPRRVAQQVFALGGWLYRDLQLNMSFEEIGALFGELRATQSHRSKAYVEALLKANGARGYKAAWQKPETAVQTFAERARGNSNRRNGRRFKSSNKNVFNKTNPNPSPSK